MSDSTGAGLVLTGSALAAFNEWMQTNQIPWKIVATAGLASLFVYGVSKISNPIGTGIGIAIFATATLTPFQGKSVFQTLQGVGG